MEHDQECDKNLPRNYADGAKAAKGIDEIVERSTQIIQDAYSSSNTLNEITRSELIENITDSYLYDEVLFPAAKIHNIAREICSTFTDEDVVRFFLFS